MSKLETEILAAGEIRRSLTPSGDLRGDIAFQHDVNALLARVEQWQMPWRSAWDISPAPLASPIVSETTPMPTLVRPSIGRLAPLVVAPRPPVASAPRARRSQ